MTTPSVNGPKGNAMPNRFETIGEYIASLPADVQPIIEQVRQTIREVAPDTGETISYNIPTFTLNGRNLIHIAAWKHHIALYPIPEGDESIELEIAPYRVGKGTLRFPLRQPVPFDLIERLVPLYIERNSDPA